MRPLFRVLVRNRAVHFLLLGGLAFTIAPRPRDPSKVAISEKDLDALHRAQAKRLGVNTLTEKQTEEVDTRAIEDDVAYREALRLGLDRGDSVVRQHLVQKMLLLAEDTAGATRTPTEEDLRTYYEATRSRWTRDASVHFIHVYSARHDVIATQALRDSVQSATNKPPLAGDAFAASRDVTSARADVGSVYGEAFASAIFAQTPGEWGAPIESKFGWHLVKVLARDEGHPASYEEVRTSLALDWAVDQRHEAVAAFFSRAFARYDVRVDGAPAPRKSALPRLALRSDPSGED